MKKRWVTPSFDSFNEPTSKKKTVVKKKYVQQTNVQTSQQNSVYDKCITWIDKFQPKIIEDLVVHPKKIKEIQNWFQNYILNNDYGKYLLLFGPCGCGKTVSLQVIAKSFNFSVIEYHIPLDKEYNPDIWNEDHYNSANEIFETFLFRASRFPSLLSTSVSKIILIKEFPNIFLHNPNMFHDILRKYLHLKTYPIVFICNDDSSSRNLFSERLRKECSIQTITFNPVSSTAVIKTLNKIVNEERKTNPILKILSNIDLQNIYQNCGGDLRSAILKLYFNLFNMNDIISEENKIDKKKKVQNSEKDKDEVIDLFKTLGRVLYSNRTFLSQSVCNKCDNYKFLHNPNELVEAISVHPTSFFGFLHENYISRFSDINTISDSANKLSVANILLTQYSKETNTIGLAIAVRGLMVANNNPVKSFKPFVKPRFQNNLFKTNISDDIQNTFPTLQHSSRDIILYTLPLLSKSSFVFDEFQKKFLDEFIKFKK